MFAALQATTGDQDDHDDENTADDNAMADDTAPVEPSNKKPVVLQPIPGRHAAENPVAYQPAGIDIEDEIT